MTDDERKNKADEIADAVIRALEALGCAAAAIMIDPGGDTLCIASGSRDVKVLANMVSQCSARILLPIMKDLCVDMPEAIMQRMIESGGYDDALPSMTRGKGISSDLAHLADYSKRVKF
jgi:hypothetical protein